MYNAKVLLGYATWQAHIVRRGHVFPTDVNVNLYASAVWVYAKKR